MWGYIIQIMVGDLWMRNSIDLKFYVVNKDLEGIETTLLMGLHRLL